MSKFYILAFVLLLGQNSWGQIRDFQTVRLNSTAGAGVASVLSTESAVLNPAGTAFFDKNSVSYHNYSTSIKNKSDDRKAANDSFAKQNRSQGLFIEDSTSALKGGVGMIRQKENHFERESYLIHGSAPMSQSAAVGVRYNYIQDKLRDGSHDQAHQITMGTTYIVDENTVVAVMVEDPTRSLKSKERLIAGFQYDLADRFIIMGDVGTQYTKDVKDKYLWRAAVQVNVFSDFFLRAGKFYDNTLETKGTGWGVSWIGPKLGIEFAQKISEQYGTGRYIYRDEKLIDTAISALIKF